MYIMGENPVISDPNIAHAEEWVRRLEFLAVQDLFLTETARWADVVLPATTWYEKSDLTATPLHPFLQLQQPAIGPQADVLERIEHQFGRQEAETGRRVIHRKKRQQKRRRGAVVSSRKRIRPCQ